MIKPHTKCGLVKFHFQYHRFLEHDEIREQPFAKNQTILWTDDIFNIGK